MENITFRTSVGTTCPAMFFLPSRQSCCGPTYNKKYPAVIIVQPNSTLKDFIAGKYAFSLSKMGFATLCFDTSFLSEKNQKLNSLDQPAYRLLQLHSAVDFLANQSAVNSKAIAILGISTGGGLAVKAACVDPRIKAIALINCVNYGEVLRRGWEGNGDREFAIKLLKGLSLKRTDQAKQGKFPASQSLYQHPKDQSDFIHPEMLQQFEHYKEVYPDFKSSLLLPSLAAWIGFDAFEVSFLIEQPLLAVVGSQAGSAWHSQRLLENVSSKEKQLIRVEGKGHCSLLSGESQKQCIKLIQPFFKLHLDI